jgi:DNA-binding winged helix-turn-helix (wHTH) protein
MYVIHEHGKNNGLTARSQMRERLLLSRFRHVLNSDQFWSVVGKSSASSQAYRFGVFEFDPAAGELRKQGMKLKLQGQPLDILAMLLECPGEVVTRENLQKRLWATGTFVDFDHSLNAAINRLRDVLDDSAETPRYVETLARRGYRFITPMDSPSMPVQIEIEGALAAPATAAPRTPVKEILGRRQGALLWGIAFLLLGAVTSIDDCAAAGPTISRSGEWPCYYPLSRRHSSRLCRPPRWCPAALSARDG